MYGIDLGEHLFLVFWFTISWIHMGLQHLFIQISTVSTKITLNRMTFTIIMQFCFQKPKSSTIAEFHITISCLIRIVNATQIYMCISLCMTCIPIIFYRIFYQLGHLAYLKQATYVFFYLLTKMSDVNGHSRILLLRCHQVNYKYHSVLMTFISTFCFVMHVLDLTIRLGLTNE